MTKEELEQRVKELEHELSGLNDDALQQKLSEETRLRQTAETALQKSVEHYRLLVTNLDAGIVVHAPDTSIIRANAKAAELLGLNRGQMMGKLAIDPEWKFLREDNTTLAVEDYPVNLVKKTQASIKNVSLGVCRPMTKDIVWLSINGFPVLNSKGELEEILISFIDRTKRREAEIALQESEQKYRDLLDNSTVGIYQSKLAGDIFYANPALLKIAGVSSLDGVPFMRSLFTYKDPARREEILELIKRDGIVKDFEAVLIVKDGKEKICSINVQAKGDLLEGTMEDITDRKQAEIALHESEQKYRDLVENSSVGVIKSTVEGRVVYANPAVMNIVEFDDMEEIMNTEISTWWKHTEQREDLIQLLKLNGYIKNYEAPLITRNGNEKICSLNVVLRGNYLSGTIIDITEQRKAEKELLIAKEKAEESDRLKTAFLQNISHEIRTPLNAIMGFSQMLNAPDLPAEKREHLTSIILNSSNQLLSIVTDVLTMSALDTKQEKVTRSHVNVNKLMYDLLFIFNPQASKQKTALLINSQLPDTQADILTDKTKLTQLLTNLITNALKFTPGGSIETGCRLSGAELEFFVKDTGTGIAKDQQSRIFDRFYQVDTSASREVGGTGLGLSICKGFAELLGGKIWLESEPGKGSVFYFTIPYIPDTVAKPEPVVVTTGGKDITILVAEDEAMNFLYLEMLFQSMNFTVLRATNGKEAFELCKSKPEISVVLMDIKMPVMDGHTAAKLIKETRPDLPIIAQSGYALESEDEKYNEGPFNAYITKPIDQNKLQQLFKKYVSTT